MRAVLLLAIAACGRVGFDAIGKDAAELTRDVTGADLDSDSSEPANVMFVTSTLQVAGAFGGLAGADAVCAQRATDAGLAGTYIAWMSTSTVNARDRLGTARGWTRVDGLPFADTVTDLIAGAILYPPRLDEAGMDYASGAPYTVTGTGSDGTASSETCADWTSTSGTAAYGYPYSGTEEWTGSPNVITGCDLATRIYCFGIDRVRAVVVPPPPDGSKRVFVSTAELFPGGGLAAADTLCQNEAIGVGLPGTYRAMLATAAPARSRFGPGPWFRLDGVRIDLPSPLAPINVTASGEYIVPYSVWTGAATPEQSGSAGTCDSWTSAASTEIGLFGNGMRSSPRWFDAGTRACPFSAQVYCFEI